MNKSVKSILKLTEEAKIHFCRSGHRVHEEDQANEIPIEGGANGVGKEEELTKQSKEVCASGFHAFGLVVDDRQPRWEGVCTAHGIRKRSGKLLQQTRFEKKWFAKHV